MTRSLPIGWCFHLHNISGDDDDVDDDELPECFHRDIPATSHTWTGHLTTTSSCPTLETTRSSTVSTVTILHYCSTVRYTVYLCTCVVMWQVCVFRGRSKRLQTDPQSIRVQRHQLGNVHLRAWIPRVRLAHLHTFTPVHENRAVCFHIWYF